MSSGKDMSTHIDKSVIYLFIGVFLISVVTFSFRYSNHVPCDEVLFSVDNKELRAGEMIQFKDKTEGSKVWKWEFGDNTGIFSQKEPLHIFKKEGEYKVRLLVNNNCERIETVSVKAKVILLDSTKFPVFTLPESIRVGRKLRVLDETENASSWEWRFGETANINATSKTAEYVYEEPGLKTVSLIVNGDLNYIAKKKINVIPLRGSNNRISEIGGEPGNKGLDLPRAPRGRKLGLPKAPKGFIPEEGSDKDKPVIKPSLSSQNLKTKFQMVSNGQMTAQDFSEFFCEDSNPLIVANGRNYTYSSFCNDIKGKNIVLENIKFIRGKDINCITSFNINYKSATDN